MDRELTPSCTSREVPSWPVDAGRPYLTMRTEPSPTTFRTPQGLLVDDDEVNLLLTVGRAARSRASTSQEASGGEPAIRVLADWLPDIVVLDAVMPGLDGFETCRELRALPASSRSRC
jgi:PleD family two-component response regulator